MSKTILDLAIDAYGVNEVARKLDMSKATVSRVHGGTYPNPTRVLEKAAEVFAELGMASVCPVLGEIHPDVCARYAAWAAEGKVHRERTYRQVKDACISCSKGKR